MLQPCVKTTSQMPDARRKSTYLPEDSLDPCHILQSAGASAYRGCGALLCARYTCKL